MDFNATQKQLQHAFSLAHSYSRELDAFVTFLVFSPLFLRMPRHVPIARRKPTYSLSDVPYYFLVFHIVTSTAELVRWHYLRLRYQYEPVPNGFDVGLTVLSSVLAGVIAPRSKFSNVALLRIGFLTAGALRVLAAVNAFLWQDQHWHRASIKLLHIFAMSGWLGNVLATLKPIKGGFSSYVAITLSLTLAWVLWESQYPWGGPVAIGTLLSIMYMDFVLTRTVKKRHLERSYFLRFLGFVGLIDKHAVANFEAEQAIKKENGNGKSQWNGNGVEKLE